MGRVSESPEDWPVTEPQRSQPWLKWDQENDADYARFQCFRDLPSPRRTMDNAHLVYRGQPYAGEDRPDTERIKVPESWPVAARRWHWRERAARFDVWKEQSQLEAERDGTLQAWREMGERHARLAMALQQKALQRLQQLNPEELSATEVRQYLVQASTLERLARGGSVADAERVFAEQQDRADGQRVAVITYVEDWRGDAARQQNRRNPDSYYGNGQGFLPQPVPAEPREPVHRPRSKKKAPPREPRGSRPRGYQITEAAERAFGRAGPDDGGRGEGAVPLPGDAPRPGGGAAPEAAVHVPGGGAEVA